MNNLDKRILEITKVYDNNGETYDRYTVFTPDGAVYGMSEGGEGFNQYIGDYTEVEMGEHLGTKLDSVPESIKNAVLNRMVDSQFVDLFQYYELMPENVSSIFNMYYEMGGNEWDYDNLKKLEGDLEELGYTFDYGLDAEPYGLRPIELSLNQLKDFEEYENGGEMNDYTKSLGMVRVKFADSKYNYETNVSSTTTEEQARNYFVGKMFDVGVYPNENMQKVIDIDFYEKGTYAKGGGVGKMYLISYMDENGYEVKKKVSRDELKLLTPIVNYTIIKEYAKGGGINSGRDNLFKSQEPHEQKYKRKREWKEYKKEGWFGDWYRDGGEIENKINALYAKSNFINDDFNWKLKLLEMLQDQSIEAYNIYQKLSKEQKEDVLQEQFEVDNDMGSDGDGDIETSRENLNILLEDAKNGKKYAKGGGVGDEMFSQELHDQYEESYVPIDLEKEITLPNGVTALWIEDNNGKVEIWKKGYGDLASAESWRKITKEQLLDEAVKEYDVMNERLRTTGKTYKTSRSTYAKGGGVDSEKVRKANEIYREHNIERKKRGIEEFSSKSVKLWKDGGYEDRLEKLNLNYEERTQLDPKKWYANGGGVGEIDMNDIEKQANFYTDESRWATKPTIEKFEKEIREYQDLKLQLDNKEIRPSKIIGSGFKPQYARPLAYKWINERILVAKRAIEIIIERQKQSKEEDISNLQKKIDYINKNYDGVTASKTYSDNRIQVVSPYFNTLNEIKRKEFEGSGLMERYGNTNSYVLYSNNIYEIGGSVGNFSEYSNDALTDAIINLSRFENTEDDIQTLKEELKKRKESIKLDSIEEMVKSNLFNGEISCEKLTEIIGCKPNYPYQIVGAIKLEKCYLRPYYKLV